MKGLVQFIGIMFVLPVSGLLVGGAFDLIHSKSDMDVAFYAGFIPWTITLFAMLVIDFRRNW